MKHIFLILLLTFGIGCQTIKSSTQTHKNKEYFDRQANSSKREIAYVQDEEDKARTEPNYSEDELKRKDAGLKKVYNYCNQIHNKKECHEIRDFIKYIEPELFDLCNKTYRNLEKQLGCWNAIANKIYTKQEIEKCKQNESYCYGKTIGVYIRPIVWLSGEEREYCNRQYAKLYVYPNWDLISRNRWQQNSFGKHPESGSCDIFGCSTDKSCGFWGCPDLGYSHCYATGEGCREERHICR